MNRFDRLTAILIHLQSKKVVIAQEIADRFEISLRTVYRDIRSLEQAGVPLFAITNFSADFWQPFVTRESAFFSRFRDIVVSGEEKMMKPDPAIYYLALDRFGVAARDALFIDDRQINVDGAEAIGMKAHLFTSAQALRARLEAEGLL